MPPTPVKSEAKLTVDISKVLVNDFTSWHGPVGRSLTRLAQRTVIAQRVLARKRTGKLAASIRWTRGISGKGLTFTSGSNLRYAGWVNNGTRAHIIRPKKPGGYLRFYWPKAGRVVYMRSVHHPGTKAYRFLEKGYRKALAAWQVTG